MTEIVHPQNRRATKDWTHFQNSTWGASCVQRRGKGRELAAFPFCGPAKYLLLLQWGTTYRARIKGGPQIAMVGRKFTKLGASLSAGSVQRGYDRYYDNPVKWTAVYGLRLRVIGDLKAVEQKDRPTDFLSTKHTLSTSSISLDSGGDVPATHCSSFARPSILEDTHTTSTVQGMDGKMDEINFGTRNNA